MGSKPIIVYSFSLSAKFLNHFLPTFLKQPRSFQITTSSATTATTAATTTTTTAAAATAATTLSINPENRNGRSKVRFISLGFQGDAAAAGLRKRDPHLEIDFLERQAHAAADGKDGERDRERERKRVRVVVRNF